MCVHSCLCMCVCTCAPSSLSPDCKVVSSPLARPHSLKCPHTTPLTHTDSHPHTEVSTALSFLKVTSTRTALPSYSGPYFTLVPETSPSRLGHNLRSSQKPTGVGFSVDAHWHHLPSPAKPVSRFTPTTSPATWLPPVFGFMQPCAEPTSMEPLPEPGTLHPVGEQS